VGLIVIVVSIKLADRCFENVAQFRYLGMTIANQNLIQGEIKRRWNSGNACYHSVQNLLSSGLLSRNIKTRIYKTIAIRIPLMIPHSKLFLVLCIS
jgi:hypothetical protein